jgi:hypothetical protein
MAKVRIPKEGYKPKPTASAKLLAISLFILGKRSRKH